MKKLNKGRSKRAIASDLSKRAKKTLKNTKENVKKWKKTSGRMDIEGVDTPKKRLVRATRGRRVKTVRHIKKPKTKKTKITTPKVIKKAKPKTKKTKITTPKVIKKAKPKTKKTTKSKITKKTSPTMKGKTINNKKDNSRLWQNVPKEKATMELKEEGETLVKRMYEINEEVKKLGDSIRYIRSEEDKEEKKHGNTELFRKLNTAVIEGHQKMSDLQEEAKEKNSRIVVIKQQLGYK
ncbi:MAG: hypothetical protein KKG64_02155 [Firmicutes bacterium]|nr:hypothetical protein [Bacillota bacterium]